MKIHNSIIPLRWAATMALLFGFHSACHAVGDTQEINLGQVINRSWDEVKSADYVWGPKQDFDSTTNETHIWLPYGSQGKYFEASGVKLTDAKPGGIPLLVTRDGNANGRMVLKFHFDKPISAFRFFAGWSEWGQNPDTVGGVEYSVDGQKWTPIRENSEGKVIEVFSDGKKKFDVPKTQDLYICFFSRDKKNPDAMNGTGRWMKFRLAGDPSWGDAETTFFRAQMQLWVTPAE